jgi:hypothetical protein
VQRTVHPVVLWATAALAVLPSVHPAAAQETLLPGGGQLGQYGQIGHYGATQASPYGVAGYGVVPGPPSQPAPASRPQSWPGTPVGSSQCDLRSQCSPAGGWAVQNPAPPYGNLRGPMGVPPRSAAQPPPAAELQPCEGALILAKVGPDVILASDVVATIDGLLEQKTELSSTERQKQLQLYGEELVKGIKELVSRGNDRRQLFGSEADRQALIQQLLKYAIETKLIYLDAMQNIPEENHPHVESSLKDQFDKVQLKKMMDEAGAATPQELDRKLRTRGTSLHRQRQAFVERILAQTWIRQRVKSKEEITYDQMVDYYRNNLAGFEQPARVRWEELMASFSKHADRQEAGAAIARMGNMVAAGAPLAQVAKANSDGVSAAEGGTWQWTSKDSLRCEAINRALFELPVGELSPILESEEGFHIVRVIERQEAHCTPFLEAQVDIEPKIRQQRTKEELQNYVARLKEKIPVWTIFDAQAAGANLSDRRAQP